jgi:hypothetical protein
MELVQTHLGENPREQRAWAIAEQLPQFGSYDAIGLSHALVKESDVGLENHYAGQEVGRGLLAYPASHFPPLLSAEHRG